MKRRLEPFGTYDPYRPRMFGEAKEIAARQQSRDLIDMVMTNEAFSARKQREIAAKTRAIAEIDAAGLENSLRAEREARKHRVTRP